MFRFLSRKLTGGNRGSHPVLKKTRQRNRQLRLSLEELESRDCPSAFYDFDIIAQTGGSITSIQPAASINDSGDVAFVASTSAGQSVYVGDGSSAPHIISFASPSSTLTYGQELQINNSGQVAAVDISPVGAQRVARIWDSNSPGTNTIVGESSSPLDVSSDFDSLGNFTSMTNDGQLAFAGLESDEPVPPSASSWEIHLADGTPMVDSRDLINDLPTGAQSEVATVPAAPAFFRLMAADGDRVVVGSRESATGPKQIVLYDSTGINTSETIATTTGGLWSDLGVRPGISDDGRIVTFYGNEASDIDGDGVTGPGLFASVETGPVISSRQLVRLASLTDGFSAFAVDQRIGITNRNDEQLASSIVFQATDTAGNAGVYRSQLKFHVDPVTGAIVTGFTASKPSSIIVQGETIPGLGTVNNVAVYDSVSNDGQAAFWVDTSGGQAIVRTKLPDQRVVLAWGHDVPIEILQISNPFYTIFPNTSQFIYLQNPLGGTMPAFTPPASQTAAFEAFKDAIRERVELQFVNSGIDGIEVVNGDPERGATVVYFTNPFPGGTLLGQAYTGVDRFNRRSTDEVAVFVQDFNPFFPADNIEIDAETITHEVGHTFGLRHIDPPGALEVMDYDSVIGDIEEFSSTPYAITEPPEAGGTVTGITHNPVYHLMRYVEGASPADLASLTPGNWDTPGIVFSALPFEFSFRLRNGTAPADTTLYNVFVLASDSAGDDAQTLAHYDSITLEELAGQTFTLTAGQSLQLFAASTSGGPIDIAMATSETPASGSLTTYPTTGMNNYVLLARDSSAAGFSTLADVTLTVSSTGGNTAPEAIDDTATALRNIPLAIDVLANDTDADGTIDPTTVVIGTGPANGSVSVNATTGTITYTPNAGFIGSDTFTYTVKDDQGAESNVATVTVQVNNQPPVAVDDTATTEEDLAVTISVLPNDSDLDGSIDPTTVTIASGPTNGLVSVDSTTGKILYTPNTGFFGTDTFTYTVKDDNGSVSNEATVTVNVASPSSPPPSVTDVRVRFGSQSYSLLGNNRTLPWTNITSIDIVFDQDVVIDQNALQLAGVNVGQYGGTFSYNAATHTATWTLASPIKSDRLTLSLDGDGATGDGNDGIRTADGVFLQGGDYILGFNVLAGDYNGDGVVTIQDSVAVRNHSPGYGLYDIFADLDGDGDVDLNDINAPRQRLGLKLP